MKSKENYAHFSGPAELRIVRTLPGPIERVWEYLTDPEKRARWFCGGLLEHFLTADCAELADKTEATSTIRSIREISG